MRFKPLIIGHRGAAGLAPENTLAGFGRAAALGVDAVELDVQTVHGRLLVIHDNRLNRTTSGTGRLTTLNIAALRKLDAGGGQPIPFLEEVLDALPIDTGVNIELKGTQTAEPVFSLLRARDEHTRDVLVSSYHQDELRRLRVLAGDAIKIAPLFRRWGERIPKVAKELGAWSVNLGVRAAIPTNIRHLNARGFRVLVFTVNTPKLARRLFSWGVDGIITDRPDRMVAEFGALRTDSAFTSAPDPRFPPKG